MLGAIAGDVIGSVYEANPVKTIDFPLFSAGSRFTDDSVLTVAIADSILNNKDFGQTLHSWARKYPDAGYGSSFIKWVMADEPQPYNSFGNGAAMRVCPAGFLADDYEQVLELAKNSAAVSHNHPEGIKGAQAVALAVFMARHAYTQEEIELKITADFGYDLDSQPEDIRGTYAFDATCQGSVPESIICFLHADSYEEAVRLAVSMGGDADTMACIAGGIAEAYFQEIPAYILEETKSRLPDDMLQVIEMFYKKCQT